MLFTTYDRPENGPVGTGETNMLDELTKEKIRKSPTFLKDLDNPSEELMLYAVGNAWNNLKYFKNPSSAVRRAALENKGWAIQYIEDPTAEEKLIAVRRDADAIGYIDSPDCQVQTEAVNSAWNAIRLIKAPCPEAKRLAIQKNEQAIGYITDYTEEELAGYLKENINIVKYIYDSIPMEELTRVLTEVFSGETPPDYIRDFMELRILDMDKIPFISSVGSKSTKQKLVDYVLGR